MAAKVKHPKGLMPLFFTEMWERYSFYGMRGLLTLYFTDQLLSGGFGMDEPSALKIYAVFLGLVYLTPIPGGFIADKFIGQRKAVFIGAFLMAIGHFIMAWSEFGELASRIVIRNNGLGLIIVGTGFLKANISTMVGQLYSENDPRKDSGFTIFYMGINVGAFGGPLLAGFLGENVDWFWGFISAGIGMLIGTIWFYSQRSKFGTAGMPPGKQLNEGETYYKFSNSDRLDIFYYVLANVVIVWGLLFFWNNITEITQSILIWTIAIVGGGFIAQVIIRNTHGKKAWSKMSVIFILAFFNVLFWSGYEQAGGTFNLFAEGNTNRIIFGWEFPATWFLSVPALFVVLLAAPFASLWIKLNQKNNEPRTTVKFAIGLILMSIGFIIIFQGAKLADTGVKVSPLWLLGVYAFHVMGELCLSPIGLSMITKLSPQKIVSVMMGLWFASIALANYLAGMLQGILTKYLPDMHLYAFLTFTTLIGGILLLLISPLVNKMMKGVH